MDEYIERDALMVALCEEIIGDGDYYNGKDDMQDQIRDMVSRFPSADVAPVRHAKWVFGGDGLVECSVCNETYDVNMLPRNYCPNCGAKCDLEG